MKKLSCHNCGASGLIFKNGIYTCEYCNSSFVADKEERPTKSSSISLQSDIDDLLDKCKSDPTRAKKYAGLILDIDPTNKEALKYL